MTRPDVAQTGQQYGLTVLIDDTREFRDGRRRPVARSSADGVALLLELRDQHIAHLWLDHDLGGDDTIWPVVRLLEDAHLQGTPFDIGLVHIQASRSGPAHRLAVSLRRAGYPTERPTDPRLWTRWGRPT